MNQPPSAVRARLRDATRPLHRALEAALPLGRGCVDRDSYRDHLRFLLSFHEPVERHLQANVELAEALPDLHARLKTSLLRDDLGAAAECPRPPRVPSPRTLPQGLGVLYVLEGATLGARILLPRLCRAGVVPGPIGCRYLQGGHPNSTAGWQHLCHVLEELPRGESEEAVAWAKLTFRSLLAWRRRWGAGA